MRGATSTCFRSAHEAEISTHAPHAGSDVPASSLGYQDWVFQPTLPMRGATGLFLLAGIEGYISTHAPHAGSDLL